MKSVFCVVILAALASPACAKEYWVEYNYSTHQCSVVEKKSDENPQQSAAAGSTAPNVAPASSPTRGTTPTMLPASSAPAQTTTVIAPQGETNNGTASATPTTAPSTPATPGAPPATNPDDTEKDPYAVTAEAWAKKKAAAEAAGTADVQTAFIGTAQHSRAEAESEMQIMRKCGIAN